MNKTKKLSKAAYRIEGQPMFKLLAKANELERKGKKILHFEIGEPDFDTPTHIVKAANNSLNRGETHYVNSMGSLDLKNAVCSTIEKKLGFKPTTGQVLITPANAIVFFLLSCIANPDTEIIVPDPGFPTYYSVIKFLGLKPVRVSLKEKNDFRMNPKDIQRKITNKTQAIIINSPSNPTGSVMTKKEMKEIALIAEKNNIYLLSDETYDEMIYDDVHFSPGIRDKCQKRTIILNSFSKTYAMTGWRLGYAVGPEEVINKMGLLLQTIISCLPLFIQKAGITALEGTQQPVTKMLSAYRKRRDEIVKGLNSLPGVSCLKPEGTFYVFPNIKGTGMTSEQFSDLMLEKAGVALLPGSNFGLAGQGYVRLCYAVSLDTIQKGIKKMRKALLDLKL